MAEQPSDPVQKKSSPFLPLLLIANIIALCAVYALWWYKQQMSAPFKQQAPFEEGMTKPEEQDPQEIIDPFNELEVRIPAFEDVTQEEDKEANKPEEQDPMAMEDMEDLQDTQEEMLEMMGVDEKTQINTEDIPAPEEIREMGKILMESGQGNDAFRAYSLLMYAAIMGDEEAESLLPEAEEQMNDQQKMLFNAMKEGIMADAEEGEEFLGVMKKYVEKHGIPELGIEQ